MDTLIKSTISSLKSKVFPLPSPLGLRAACTSIQTSLSKCSQTFNEEKDTPNYEEKVAGDASISLEDEVNVDNKYVLESTPGQSEDSSKEGANLPKKNRGTISQQIKSASFAPLTINPYSLISSKKMVGPLGNSTGIPWHSFVSMAKLNSNQVRYKTTEYRKCPAVSKTACDVKKVSLDVPLPCVCHEPKVKPCRIPKQQLWPSCAKMMCLPCCECVWRPISCSKLMVGLNTCPRITYRIPAYSECLKRPGKLSHMKECCHVRRKCYSRDITEREIHPLIPIKRRQSIVLGFEAKIPEEPWGSYN